MKKGIDETYVNLNYIKLYEYIFHFQFYKEIIKCDFHLRYPRHFDPLNTYRLTYDAFVKVIYKELYFNLR